MPYEERRIAVAPGGGEVYALAIDPEQALLEYLEQFYNLRRAGSMLKKLGAIDFATTSLTGFKQTTMCRIGEQSIGQISRTAPYMMRGRLAAAPTFI